MSDTERLVAIEEKVDNLVDSMNTSCTIKDKQITEGDSKTFWKCIYIIGVSASTQFALFIGAVVYFNNMDGTLFNRINKDYEDTVEVRTLTQTVLKRFDKFESKLDSVLIHKHDRSELLKRVDKIENYQNRNFGYLQGMKGKK